MFDAWSQLPAQFIFTTFDVRTALPHSRTSVNIAAQAGATSRAVEEPLEALSVARRVAGATDLVVITGSTFLVGRCAIGSSKIRA